MTRSQQSMASTAKSRCMVERVRITPSVFLVFLALHLVASLIVHGMGGATGTVSVPLSHLIGAQLDLGAGGFGDGGIGGPHLLLGNLYSHQLCHLSQTMSPEPKKKKL